MRGRRLIAFLLSLVVLPAVSAAPPLRAVLFDVAPYAMAGADGRVEGRYADLVRELGRHVGRELEISLEPFARIPGSLKAGSADLTVAFSTPALAATARPLGEVMMVDSLVVTSKVRPATQLAELSGRVVGRARGGCLDLAQQQVPGLQFYEVNGFASGLQMLALGRLDALCLTREVLQHYSRETGVQRSQLGPEIVISRRAVQLWARRSLDRDLQARLSAALPREPAPSAAAPGPR